MIDRFIFCWRSIVQTKKVVEQKEFIKIIILRDINKKIWKIQYNFSLSKEKAKFSLSDFIAWKHLLRSYFHYMTSLSLLLVTMVCVRVYVCSWQWKITERKRKGKKIGLMRGRLSVLTCRLLNRFCGCSNVSEIVGTSRGLRNQAFFVQKSFTKDAQLNLKQRLI